MFSILELLFTERQRGDPPKYFTKSEKRSGSLLNLGLMCKASRDEEGGFRYVVSR